jgi:hypothetical protein
MSRIKEQKEGTEVMTKLTPTLTQGGPLPVFLKDQRRKVISERPPSFTHIKQLAAIIIVALGFLFWLWFGASTYHAPRASYPYYDMQKPVPPWSEPMALKGNQDRGGEYR